MQVIFKNIKTFHNTLYMKVTQNFFSCEECLTSSGDDSLRFSLSRINAYKALGKKKHALKRLN